MKQVAGRLKGELAQFRELAAFAQFGSELDEDAGADRPWQAHHGDLQASPVQPDSGRDPGRRDLGRQNGYLDDVPVERVKEFQNKLTELFTTRKGQLLGKIGREKELSDALKAELKAAAEEFKQTWK